MNNKIKQPRLTIREQNARMEIITKAWKNFKAELTMEELSHVFRMPLAQLYKIIKSQKNEN